MSWLADIAGKAENFLNKVDQGAASALQKENLKNTFHGSYNEVTQAENPPVPPAKKYVTGIVTKSPLPVSETTHSPEHKSLTKPKLVVSRDRNQEDDEKLLAFLNSAKNMDDFQTKSKLQENPGKVKSFKSKSDDGGNIRFEKQCIEKQSADNPNSERPSTGKR